MTLAKQLQEYLGLRTMPVAVTFQAAPPPGVARVAAPGPSSCTYWKRAADGETFYTEASDHYHCPIGGYTHGVDLPPAQTQELQDVVGVMVGLGYIRQEEVALIPRREQVFGVAVYSPLDQSEAEPDVVLIRGNAMQIMLVEEAAGAAGIGSSTPMMGRPTCAALPTALKSQRGVASLGCIGNRVYTDMADDELVYALPGKHLAEVVDKLGGIVHANQELMKYHRGRMPAPA